MNRTLRSTSPRFLAALALGAALLSAHGASAAPQPREGEDTLDSKLGRILGTQGGLTSSTVAARAEATSFDVKAKQADVEAAQAGVNQALVAYFPRLTGTARYTRLSPLDAPSLGNLVVAARPGPVAPADPTNPPFAVAQSFPVVLDQRLFQASLNVPISDYVLKISQGYAAATKSAKAAELTEKATRLKVAADGKAAYYAWVRAKLQRVVAEQSVAQAKAHLVDAKNAFDAGTISRADVMRFESQLATSQLLLERATSLESTTEAQVRVAMHDPEGSGYEIGESIEVDAAPQPGEEGDLVTMWFEASRSRFEVRALDESTGSLRDQAKVARAGNWPRVDAFGNVYYANPSQRVFPAKEEYKATWDVGVQLTWSPNDLANAGPAAAALESRAASLAAQRQSLADGIRLEVTQARNSIREARAAIESSAQGLAASEESYRVRRSLFKNGRATSVELTDAETDLTRARLESINARVDLQLARVRLEHALGRDAIARR
jgi:outer membrane protein TolC